LSPFDFFLGEEGEEKKGSLFRWIDDEELKSLLSKSIFHKAKF